MTLESEIEKYLRKKCQENDILYYKFTSPANSGVPDRILIGYGQTLFVELKRPPIKNKVFKPRPLQVTTFNAMRKHGAVVYVIDTKQKVDDLIKKLVPKSNTIKTHNTNTSNFEIYTLK